MLFTHNPPLQIGNQQNHAADNLQLQSQHAMANLGSLYRDGQGVPQSYERAAEQYKQSAAKGEPVSLRNQAKLHLQIVSETMHHSDIEFQATLF